MSSLRTYGASVLMHEGEALRAAAEQLPATFDDVVQLIHELPRHRKVITSGIGKTGLIAQKFSASLASLGIPSFFVHAAEAFHGDLGRFERGDLAFLISSSGESAELLRLLPYLRRIGTSTIALTTNSDSSLARGADLSVATPRVIEAGPHNLAPSTSPVVLLGLCDAITMTVLSLREFSPAQYASLHPGGSLGYKLLTVEEVMRRGEQCCVLSAQALCKEVIHAISATPGRPGAAALVNGQGTLTGIFTDGDLRRCLDTNSGFLEQPVAGYMGRNPKRITQDRLAEEALKILTQHQIDQVVVVDAEERPVGIVDIQDLVRLSRDISMR